jgi:N-acetylmuramoyl-L-alanine amidase CwlA
MEDTIIINNIEQYISTYLSKDMKDYCMCSDSHDLESKIFRIVSSFNQLLKDHKQLQKDFDIAVSLIDGVYEIVELYENKDSPYKSKWKENWIKQASLFGASGE